MIIVTPHYSRAQLNPPLQAGLSQALAAINIAEAAGATPNETAPLVALLNKALELNQEASSLPTNQTEQRNSILSSVNQILTNVTNQANDLATTSTQRTYTNKIITYVTGLLVAVIGTFAYVLCVELYQRYRIKRTFQMRVRPK
jgi:predicted PurR-regulated permease PerM